MNKFWKKFCKKIKKIFSEKNINAFFENVIIVCLSSIATITIFGTSSFFLPDKDQIIIILTIVGLSIAYASFFISNIEKLVESDKNKSVLNLSKILIVSPVFPIFSILLAQSKANFGKFNIAMAWGISILSLVSICIFFFCFIKLLSILLKSVFRKNKYENKNKS